MFGETEPWGSVPATTAEMELNLYFDSTISCPKPMNFITTLYFLSICMHALQPFGSYDWLDSLIIKNIFRSLIHQMEKLSMAPEVWFENESKIRA